MINDNTILSSFNDRPTLLEWLKKVEEALKTDTATAIKFENTSPNHYIASIEFANGNKIVSDDIAFPDTINQVSVTDGELIINYVSGRTDNLGKLNAYEGVIIINSETNTTEIGNNAVVGGNLQVNGTITAGGNVLTAVVANPTEDTTETLSKVKIGNTAYAVGGGGSGDNFLLVDMNFSSTSGSNSFYVEAPLDDKVKAKILNGDIKVISGHFVYQDGQNGYFAVIFCGYKPYGPETATLYRGVNYFDRGAPKIELGFINVAPSSTKLSLSITQYALS